jgi:hypothetical protein
MEWKMHRFIILILLLSIIPPSKASLTDEVNGGSLFFSCVSDDECLLTPVATGEETITGSVQANPLSTETVALEFDMFPEQTELALLPDVLEELVIDLRVQGDVFGLYKPQIDVRIIIGTSVTNLESDESTTPNGNVEPYQWTNEPLNLDQGRLLWPDEPVRIRVTFTLDRPSTWEFHLREASYIDLDITWSDNIEAKNVDEPTSALQPKPTSLDEVHRGALVDIEDDCWSFSVQEHEILRILIQWEDVPLELQQSNGVHRLRTSNGLQVATPEVVTKSEDDTVLTTYRWRALDPGDYIFCLKGQTDRYQPYVWSGLYAVESSGPTDSSEFSGKVVYEANYFTFSTGIETELEPHSGLILLPSIIALIFFMMDIRRKSTSNMTRFGVFLPICFVLLMSGVVSPLWAMADEVQDPDEWTFDQLLEERIQQLWDVSSPATPQATMIEHVGATWGVRDGEQLKLWLEIEEAYQREDGKWQLIVADFDEIRLDSLIFNQISEARQGSMTNGLDEHIVQFSIIATRALLLDLMMLEALLVVDEEPTSSIHHIDTMMVDTSSFGSTTSPTWATRPVDIDDSKWKRLQSSIYPDRITVSLCDCALDLLDLQVSYSSQFNENDSPEFTALQQANGIIPYSAIVAIACIILGAIVIQRESRRRNAAKKLAESFVGKASIWNSFFTV